MLQLILSWSSNITWSSNLSKEEPTTETMVSCSGSFQLFCFFLPAGGVVAIVKLTCDGKLFFVRQHWEKQMDMRYRFVWIKSPVNRSQ